MTPINLMIISGIVFGVSIFVCLANFIAMWNKTTATIKAHTNQFTLWNTNLRPSLKIVIHLISGLGANIGAFGAIAGFIWFLVKGG